MRWCANLTFDIPEGEMAVAGCLRCQGEVESMARLGFIFIHHTNRVNKLQEATKEKKRKGKKKGEQKKRNN